MEALKNRYSQEFISNLSKVIVKTLPSFDKKEFENMVFDAKWTDRELKQRMRHITLSIYHQFSGDFPKLSSWVQALTSELKNSDIKEQSFEYMFLPEFIELYGLDDFEESMRAFQSITTFTSCEFAIRPFLIKYPERTMRQMNIWSSHNHPSVRRFSSEGCRPRLPWAISLPRLKKDPSLILPLLVKLQQDPSDYVRRSVANNLNDISKDHPEVVISIAKKWIGKNKKTDQLIKHGCRTLLKSGNSTVMSLFGFAPPENILLNKFHVIPNSITIGSTLKFSFELVNNNPFPIKIRLEYGIYFMKANGRSSRKVFKISEKIYPSKSTTMTYKSQDFKDLSTRKHYEGEHHISLILNGLEWIKHSFTVCSTQ